MPGRHDLPEALAPLSRRNAIELSETRFHADVNRLIEAIEKSFAVVEKKEDLSATPVAPPAEPASIRPPESKDLPEARSRQDSVATAKDPTTPVKSVQTTPAIPPAASISAIVGLKEPEGWTRKHLITVSAIGTLVILLLALAVFLMRRGPAFDEGPRVTALEDKQAIASAMTLGYLVGHKEPPLSNGPISVLKTFIENENIKFQELELLYLDEFPTDVNAVMIIGPQYDFADREMRLLRDFWDKQGRILVLLGSANIRLEPLIQAEKGLLC